METRIEFRPLHPCLPHVIFPSKSTQGIFSVLWRSLFVVVPQIEEVFGDVIVVLEIKKEIGVIY